jgi:high-affinity Fe2+/Pb2+ permease
MAKYEFIAVGLFALILGFAFVPVLSALSGLDPNSLEGFILTYIVYILGLFFIIYGAFAK